jgi:hypothetical protein
MEGEPESPLMFVEVWCAKTFSFSVRGGTVGLMWPWIVLAGWVSPLR